MASCRHSVVLPDPDLAGEQSDALELDEVVEAGFGLAPGDGSGAASSGWACEEERSRFAAVLAQASRRIRSSLSILEHHAMGSTTTGIPTSATTHGERIPISACAVAT